MFTGPEKLTGSLLLIRFPGEKGCIFGIPSGSETSREWERLILADYPGSQENKEREDESFLLHHRNRVLVPVSRKGEGYLPDEGH
jgi:hypothetical protein